MVMLTTNDVMQDIIQIDEGSWALTNSDDGRDGGWTYGGMTKNSLIKRHPAYESYDFYSLYSNVFKNSDSQVFREALKAAVLDSYTYNYINPSFADKLPIYLRRLYLSAYINNEVFGVKCLQMLINWNINTQKLPGPLLQEDGVLGTFTILDMSTVQCIVPLSVGKDPSFYVLQASQYVNFWKERYAELCREQPGFQKYYNGWINRTTKAFKQSLTLIPGADQI